MKKILRRYGNALTSTGSRNFPIAQLAIRNIKQCNSPQGETESIDDFISRLRLQAAQCRYRTIKMEGETNSELEERFIEELIAGTCYPEIQKDLLSQNPMLTLVKAVETARNAELSHNYLRQLQLIQGESEIKAISINTMNRQSQKCQKCGGKHPTKPYGECPAYGTECHKCGKHNHWATVCKSEPKLREQWFKYQAHKRNKKYINTLAQAEDSEDDFNFEVLNFQAIKNGDADKKEEVCWDSDKTVRQGTSKNSLENKSWHRHLGQYTAAFHLQGNYPQTSSWYRYTLQSHPHSLQWVQHVAYWKDILFLPVW